MNKKKLIDGFNGIHHDNFKKNRVLELNSWKYIFDLHLISY